MYTAKVTNSSGDTIQLTQDEGLYQVLSIRGLNPPKATINLTNIAGLDGAKFNSSKLESRNIVILLKLNGDVEANRQRLYEYFPTKEAVRFYYQNENRNVYIDGYVESCEVDLFSASEQMQISIICPQPYFRGLNDYEVDASTVTALFTFEFAIDEDEPVEIARMDTDSSTVISNESDSATGMVITIVVNTACSLVRVQNTDTGEYIALSYSFLAGDVITIDTHKGQKNVKLTRNGADVNIFSALVSGSTFLQLAAGDNTFSYLVDGGGYEEYVNVLFTYYYLFRGV